MKLYAATTIAYEYALWATSKKEAREILGIGASDQSTNKNLKRIIADRTKVYRRPLIDGAEWRILQNKF